MSVGLRVLHLKVAYFIGFLHFERHSQNEIGKNGILVLWCFCEKL